MFNVWIVGTLLLLFILLLASFDRGEERFTDNDKTFREAQMKFEVHNEMKNDIADLVEEKKDR